MMPHGSQGSQSGQGSQTSQGTTEATAATTQNSAGYAATGAAGTFTSVSSSRAQPAVSCGSSRTFSSFWVGLDGTSTSTLEQTGTEADCAGGQAAYSGWFEFFPAAPVTYDEPVRPGDEMTATVTAGAGGAFVLTLRDATQQWQQSAHQTVAGARLESAEVIAEAPSSQAVLPLADFGTVNFTGATVNGQPIGSDSPVALTMASAANQTEATPSALAGGNGFSVTGGSGTGTGGGRHHRHHGGGA
jgi:hypothetical protein